MGADSSEAKELAGFSATWTRVWLPVEIVVRVFQECNTFSDAIALASTSEFLRDVWKEHQPQILGKIARRQVPGYDLGLVAVRSINIASNQIQSLKAASSKVSEQAEQQDTENYSPSSMGAYPAPIDLASLSKQPQSPSISELQSLLSLRHLVECILYAINLGNDGNRVLAEPYISKIFSSGKDGEIYRERVYSSFYLILGISASHATAYLQPFLLPCPQARRFYRLFSEGMNDEERRNKNTEYCQYHFVPPFDAEYFQKFPPFNHYANNTDWTLHRPCFESSARWLMDNVDARMVITEAEKQGLSEYSDEEISKAWKLQQAMLALDCWWALNTFLFPNGAVKGLVNESSLAKDAYVIEKDKELIYKWPLTLGKANADGKSVEGDADLRIKIYTPEVKVILPGMYQVQLVTLPRKVEDTAKTGVYLVKYSPDGEKLVDIPDVLYQIQLELGEVAPYSGFMREPQMELAFGNYVMREHLGVKFGSNVFTPTRPDWLNWPHFGFEGALWDVGRFVEVEWPLAKM